MRTGGRSLGIRGLVREDKGSLHGGRRSTGCSRQSCQFLARIALWVLHFPLQPKNQRMRLNMAWCLSVGIGDDGQNPSAL